MKSYFFIPANNRRFLKKSLEMPASEIILDLEDALFNTDLDEAIDNIIDLHLSINCYVRLAFDPLLAVDQLIYIMPLVKSGFSKFVIPKIDGRKSIDEIEHTFKSWTGNNHFQFIVLVENPKAILNLSEILSHNSVVGVGFGSHDYCSFLGMEHTYENLYWARMEVLNTGKALGKEVIDIASMNINDVELFSNECKDAFKKGFESKFIIHPWQLHIFNNLNYYSSEEINHAIDVKNYIRKIGGEGNFTIAKINNRVVEKPHLARIKQILKDSGNGTF